MGFASPNPITWPELQAFQALTGVRFNPWELAQIEAIDNAYVGSFNAKAGTPKPQKGMRSAISMSDPDSVKSLLGSIGNRRVVKRDKGKKTDG